MKQFLIPAIVCIFVYGTACKKGLPDRPDVLAVHKFTVTLTGAVDSRDTIFIAADGDWVATLETGINWLKVEPATGTGDGFIVISSILANITNARKTANIEIRLVNGTTNRIITVTQFQLNEQVLQAVFGGEGFDAFSDLTITPEGGYIAIGFATSKEGDGTGNKGGQDLWAVKFDDEGQKVWHKTYGGTLEDVGRSIVRTSDNNYLILGSTLSPDGDVTDHKGERDAWLLKIDGDGSIVWQKTLGGSAEDMLYSLKPTGDGNFLLGGYTYSNDGDVSANHGDADGWLLRIDEQGDILWEKTYGGTKQDLVYDATPVSDGGYIFCGRLLSMDGDAADRTTETFTGWFVKINAAGDVSGKVYLGSSEYDYGTVAIEALNGDFVFAGGTNTAEVFDNFHAQRDAFVLRLDGAGNVRWKKAYGGSMRDEPGDLIETDDGGFIFAGLTMSSDGDIPQALGGEDAWIMKLSSEGNIIRNNIHGGGLNDNVFKIKDLGNNNFGFAGMSASFEDGYPSLTDIMHGWFRIVEIN